MAENTLISHKTKRWPQNFDKHKNYKYTNKICTHLAESHCKTTENEAIGSHSFV